MSDVSPSIRFVRFVILGADGVLPATDVPEQGGWWRQFLTALAGRAGSAGDAARIRPVHPENAGGEDGSQSNSGSQEDSATQIAQPAEEDKEAELPDPPVGFTGEVACQVVGITDQQLDYWDRTGLVSPSLLRTSTAVGAQRLYSFKDMLLLKVVKRLIDAGVSLSDIRLPVDHLHFRNLRDFAGITLLSDGQTVFEATSPRDVMDLLQSGRAMFGIAVGGAVRELSAAIVDFPIERDTVIDSGEQTRDWLLRPVG